MLKDPQTVHDGHNGRDRLATAEIHDIARLLDQERKPARVSPGALPRKVRCHLETVSIEGPAAWIARARSSRDAALHLDGFGRRFFGEVILLAAHAVEFALVGFLLDRRAGVLAELVVLDLPAALAKAIVAGLPADLLTVELARGLDDSPDHAAGHSSIAPGRDEVLAVPERLIEHCTVEVWGPRITPADARLQDDQREAASAQPQA